MISRSFLVLLLAAIAACSLGFSPSLPRSTRSSVTPVRTAGALDTTTTTLAVLKFFRKTEEKTEETTEEEAQEVTANMEEAEQPEEEEEVEKPVEEENSAKAKMTAMMKPIKEAGPAGAISLFLWEGAFWALAIPVSAVLYYQSTGSWPDWSQKDDVAKVVGEAVIFANIARFALPVRVGLAVATTPWVKDNVVDRFGLFQNKEEEEEEEA